MRATEEEGLGLGLSGSVSQHSVRHSGLTLALSGLRSYVSFEGGRRFHVPCLTSFSSASMSILRISCLLKPNCDVSITFTQMHHNQHTGGTSGGSNSGNKSWSSCGLMVRRHAVSPPL